MKKIASRRGPNMEGAIAKSVDEYLSPLPADLKKVLENLRRAIKEAAPKAQETISYGMPAYKYLGRLVYFATFKNHSSFFPASKTINRKFGKELKKFDVSGTTIHFTAEKPLPISLVKKIVKARMEENELIDKKRQGKKRKKKSSKA